MLGGPELIKGLIFMESVTYLLAFGQSQLIPHRPGPSYDPIGDRGF
jgi:hypothetical protein